MEPVVRQSCSGQSERGQRSENGGGGRRTPGRTCARRPDQRSGCGPPVGPAGRERRLKAAWRPRDQASRSLRLLGARGSGPRREPACGIRGFWQRRAPGPVQREGNAGRAAGTAPLAGGLPRSAGLRCLCPASAGRAGGRGAGAAVAPAECCGGGKALTPAALCRRAAASLGTGTLPREGLVCTALDPPILPGPPAGT